jgi:PAS domain S-box-containing protein
MTKILAIDDKEDNLISLSAILKGLLSGCTVITALSGLEGIEKAKAELPDTILLDIKMPGMDGYETCKRLKENKDTGHIPVILISAIQTGSRDMVKGLDTGADVYLAKPIDENVLIAQVKTALRMKNAEDNLRERKDILEDLVQERTIALTDSNARLRSEIEERKRAEQELKKSENRFRDITNSMADWIWEVDKNGRYTYVSQTVKNILGYSYKELLGKTLFELIPGKESGKIKEIFLQIVSKSRPIVDLENWNLAKDGTQVCFLTNGVPIFDVDGKLQGYRGVAKDITKQKKLATEKMAMEARLQQAQKMESIGTLAGGIAHDFNNILFPVVGYSEMLLEDIPEDSPIRDNLNQIYTSSLRAKELVKQILTFSRQESSELMLMRIQPIVKEALKLIRSTIPTTIEIKQDINPDCGVVKADPTQIHQIIMNLATNAFHAMEKTGGQLKVSLKEVELGELDLIKPDMIPGIYICLSIADTGVGMDKNLTGKIFDPFFTTKGKGKGTGMGLSVVHGIVNALGGAIHVYSEPGKGTQFHVYFPIEKKSFEKQATHSKAQIQGGTEQILLVDDEEAILTMEKQMLERLGYQVTTRTSSLEALEAFNANPDKFDMVITDMAMPNLPGDKLSAKLNKLRPDISILLCTGFSETMPEEKAASLGINGFLLKPIVMKDLAQKIREILDNDNI